VKVAEVRAAALGALDAAKKEVRVSEVVTIPVMKAKARIRSKAMNIRSPGLWSACATRACLHDNERQRSAATAFSYDGYNGP
jgi:hypothetical protein